MDLCTVYLSWSFAHCTLRIYQHYWLVSFFKENEALVVLNNVVGGEIKIYLFLVDTSCGKCIYIVFTLCFVLEHIHTTFNFLKVVLPCFHIHHHTKL